MGTVDYNQTEPSAGRRANTPDELTLMQNIIATIADAGARLDGVEDRLWVPAGLFQRVGGTPLFETNRTGGVGWPGWFMDASSAETVQTAIAVPAWTTMDVDLYWSNGGAGTGDVVWQLSTKFVGDTEDTSSITAASNVTATAPAQFILKVTSVGTGITVTTAKLASLRFLRFATDAADSLANDAVMNGLMLKKAS